MDENLHIAETYKKALTIRIPDSYRQGFFYIQIRILLPKVLKKTSFFIS